MVNGPDFRASWMNVPISDECPDFRVSWIDVPILDEFQGVLADFR
jgi:hypothetical protein